MGPYGFDGAADVDVSEIQLLFDVISIETQLLNVKRDNKNNSR